MTGMTLDLARTHAPLLIMLAPFIGAALAFVTPSSRLSWGLALLATAVSVGFAWDTALRALVHGAPPLQVDEGFAVWADGLGVFAAALLAMCALLTAIAAGASIRKLSRRVTPMAMTLLLCVVGGWLAGLFARDLAGVLVACQVAWLASIGLCAITGGRGALNGAMRMLALGGAGAALMLLGAILLHRATGTLDLAIIASAHIESAELAAAGAGLVLLGLAIYAGAAPMHTWIGAVQGAAGALASPVLGVVGAIGAAAVMIRVAAHLLMAPALGEGLSMTLAVLGCVSVVIGSMQAVGARNLPRLAGHAGVAQLGGVLLCVALGSPAGLAAALVQLTAFAGAGLALYVGGAAGDLRGIEGLDGMGRRAPLAGAALTAGAISLMGAPLTLGFLGRWRLVEAGVGAGWWWAAGAVIFASLAGVFFGGRIVERLYFRRLADAYVGARDAWAFALTPALVVAIFVIMLGLAPGALLDAANVAAALFMGGGA